jgi:crossover junction endodeoxyribonuclease RusA
VSSVTIPWPDKALSPNARSHFHAKAKVAKAYREQAYWLAYSSKLVAPEEGTIALRLDFHPPDARKRDLDNMLASCKAAIDGIADALEVNDQRFGFWLSREAPVKGGKVVVSIMPGTARACEARPIGEIIKPIVADIVRRMGE